MLLEGKKVFVGPFLKRTDRPADKEAHYTNIYVKNLAESVTEEQLENMFGEHGKVRCAAACCAGTLRRHQFQRSFGCHSPVLFCAAYTYACVFALMQAVPEVAGGMQSESPFGVDVSPQRHN